MMGRACRQPWLRIHCTAGASCGILSRVSGAAAAASETQSVMPCRTLERVRPHRKACEVARYFFSKAMVKAAG